VDTAVKRLNWGCGLTPQPGWINSDQHRRKGIDIVCDIRDGLPIESESIDYAVSIHALVEIPYPDVDAVLKELRRVLKPGGVLRLGLPDFERFIQAYTKQDHGYFSIPDEEARSFGGKFIVFTLWYGGSRTPLTYDFTEELLQKAGFAQVTRCGFRQTASPFGEIVDLDDREQHSFFAEAVR
jgi:predicted SAM-dependent methyltransferase